MRAEAQELATYIENDRDLYHQQELSITSITKNLATKMAKGVYDKEKAIKLWMYLMEAGAKKYAKEFDIDWKTIFPKKVQQEAAEMFNETFLTEYSLGNYHNLLPKKYQR